MKQNCDLCKVTSTSSSPPPPPTGGMASGVVGGIKTEKMKVALEDSDRDHHRHLHRKKDSEKSAKYLKHCPIESPPLKPVTASSMIRTIPPSNQAAVVAAAGQQLPYHHHLHPSRPQHHQFNGFDEYYSAPLLSPSLMMDMMLAAHLLRGYYQPAGPLISSHPGGQQPQSPLKSKSDPSAGPTQPPPNSALGPQAGGPGQPHPVHQPTPSVGLAEHHRLEAGDPGAANDLHRSQAFRYIPQPTGPYSRPPIHQLHCTYPPPPPPPTYYAYGQHPQELCYPPAYQPYYPQKMYATAPPPPPPSAYRRYVSGSYYQAGDLYDHQTTSRLLPPPPPQSSGPPPTLDQYPYYAPYASASAAQWHGRAVQSYMDSAPPPGSGGGAGGTGLPPPIPYPTSCPCPMQSCPKNVHTGPLIGSSSSGKGPGQQQQQQQQGGIGGGQTGSTRTCKTEEPNEYPKHNSSHYEQTVPTVQRQETHPYGASAPSYTVNTNLEPEMSISPARGSTGLSIPTTPVSPSNSEISGSNGSATGERRKARIGKNSVREQQLLMTNGSAGQPGATQMEGIYAQELPPHLQHYHHEMMYNPNLYPGHFDQRFASGQPTFVGHIHHVPQPPIQPPPANKEDDLFVPTATVKQEPVIKTERLEVKQEQVSGDEESSSSPPVEKIVAKGVVEERRERQCDSASVTMPNKNFAATQRVDQCRRGSDKTNEEESAGVSCDINRNRNTDEDEEVEKDQDECDSSTVGASSNRSSLLKLSGKDKTATGPKKSNYKKLIKPAEPKPYLSCATSGSLKRGDKMRKKYPNSSDRARMRMLKRHRRKQQHIMGTGRLTIRGRGKVRSGKIGRSKGGKILKRSKKAPSTTSETSLSSVEGVAQDKNNNNTDKELNNNVVSESQVTDEEGKRSNLDDTIDLVARGHFEAPKEVVESPMDEEEGSENEEEDAPLAKKAKIEAPLEEAPSKSKPPKSNKGSKPVADTKKEKAKKNPKAKKESEKKEVKVPEKPKSKSKAKKSKASKDSLTAKTADKEKEDSPLISNNSLPESDKKCSTVEGGSQIANSEASPKNAEPATTVDEKVPEISVTNVLDESCSTTDEVKVAKGRPGRRPKKGGLKLSSRKRRAQQRLTKAMEEIPIKKHVGAPRWSNGWNWLGDSFQGLIFLNSDDPPVMRTCYPAMKHSEGDIIRPRDCVLLRAGSKRNELPYVAKVAHLWENPEDGEMMMSLLWYYRPEHTEQGRQEADGGEEVFASKHKDHNSVACIEDKCYVLTFNEYCRYRRILKSVEENLDVSPSIVPALKPDQAGMLAPKVPLNTSPELVMFCHRVYEFRFKRMKNFY